jgi:sensor c-di-GMP phosphodiesterase-like protein
MSARALRWLTIMLALAAALPAAGVIGFSYWDTRRDISVELTRISAAARDRIDSILDSSNRQLQVLHNDARNLDAGCSAETQSQLRDIVFRGMYFREAGVVRDGNLLCNQFERFEPPIDIAERLKDHIEVEGLMIAAPTPSRNSVPSLMLAMRYAPDTYGYVLVNPDVLLDFLPFFELTPSHGVFLLYDRRVAFSGIGIRDDLADVIVARNGLHRSPEGVMAQSARSRKYPIEVVAVPPPDAVTSRWLGRLPWFILIAVLLATAAYYFVRQFGSQALSLRAELNRAIAGERITAVYQPCVDMNTGLIVGVEVLARWADPTDGPISPDVFVPVAEQSGQLTALTALMFKRVRLEIVPLLKITPWLRVSINCHISQLYTRELVAMCDELITAGLPAGQLVIEITERAGISKTQLDVARANMAVMRERGVRFAMDDFGVGYSNLNGLQALPFAYLKIDKAFVDGIASASESSGFVDQIVAIGAQNKLTLIAEGVELPHQAEFLESRGIAYAQGWHFAKPMDAAALARLLPKKRVTVIRSVDAPLQPKMV